MLSFFAKLEDIPNTQRMLIFVFLLVIAPGGYYQLFSGDNAKTIGNLQEERSKLDLTLRKHSARARRLGTFEKELKQLDRNLKLALAKLPDKKEIPELLQQISRLAFSSGIEFTLFKPESEVPKNFYAEIPVRMQMRSDYHSVGRFFSELSRLERIINLRSMKIVKAETEGQRLFLNVSGVATTFRFLSTPQAPPGKGKSNAKRRKK